MLRVNETVCVVIGSEGLGEHLQAHQEFDGILGSKYDMSLRIDGITYGIDVISRRLDGVN